MNAAARKRAQREREERGLAILRLEVDLIALCDLLVAYGFLKAWQVDDRTAVERAVENVLALLIVTCDTATPGDGVWLDRLRRP